MKSKLVIPLVVTSIINFIFTVCKKGILGEKKKKLAKKEKDMVYLSEVNICCSNH